MREVTCKCGKSKKSFKFDIGPFYIDECCTAAGYDHQGNLVNPPKAQEAAPQAPSEPPQAPQESQAGSNDEAPTEQPQAPTEQPQTSTEPQKLSKSKLKDMKVENLKDLAASKNVEGVGTMTKKQLVEALLK